MKSPYEILGISPNDDDAVLREAYRRLARAYDGDTRRMNELNDAYDAIVLSRGQGGGQAGREPRGANSCSGRQSQQNSSNSQVEFGDIRRRIQCGRYDDALTLLDGIPPARRTAEWYYLKGCAQRGRGWLEEAERNFSQAVRQEPGNSEYRAAWDQLRGGRGGANRSRSSSESTCCKVCAGLACLDCLCDCM